MRGGAAKGSKTSGENHTNGTLVHYYLKNKPGEKDTVSITLLEMDGDTIKVFSSATGKDEKSPRKGRLEPKQGGNLFVWNHRYPDAEKFEGMVLWSYDLEGPKAVPGQYRVRVSAAGQTEEQTFAILPDPRSGASAQVFNQQFDFVQSIRQKLTETHRAIREIREVRKQLKSLAENLPKEDRTKPITVLSAKIDSTMTSVEEALYQTKNRSSQDPLNFPVRLNDKLANLMGLNVDGDFPPTQQSVEVRTYLFGLIDAQLSKWKAVKERERPQFNKLVREAAVDVIRVKENRE